jgi:hypothetical protein
MATRVPTLHTRRAASHNLFTLELKEPCAPLRDARLPGGVPVPKQNKRVWCVSFAVREDFDTVL